MGSDRRKHEGGFTILETAVVVLVAGAVLAIATPKISNAMREYRLNIAMRRMGDLIQQVKMQAVSDNRRASIAIDTEGKRIGLITYNADNTVASTRYVPLPQGISFGQPQGVNAPVNGAPTTSVVSFPAQGQSTTVFQQDFNSRGFPVVADGVIHSIYLTNGRTYRALTMNSVGNARTFHWTGSDWRDVRR